MSVPEALTRNYPELKEWCILSGYRGSVAHRMYVPSKDPNSTDDKDAMYICVPPIEYYFGLKTYGSRGTKEIKFEEWDIVVYEARKFVSLLTKGNPNVMSLLWLEDSCYINKTTAGKLLIEKRDLFVGRHVFMSFAGYARGQRKRMTRIADGTAYMGTKRRQLYEKYGYDCKNAAHMIRLLRMGIEFLVDGELHVKRLDAKELLQIKRGEWTLEQVNNEAERLFDKLELAYIHSKLPAQPDMDKVNDLLNDVIHNDLVSRFELPCLSRL